MSLGAEAACIVLCLLTITSDGSRSPLEDLLQSRNSKTITGKAKNIILVIGDGMSIDTITAARVWKGQLSGKDELLTWENFPYAGLLRTANTDYETSPDSGGTATALLAGVKTYKGAIGVDTSHTYGGCRGYNWTAQLPPSLLHLAMKSGRRVGMVTTTRITHATPACAFAHINNRGWETDADILKWQAGNSKIPDYCPADIARQMMTGDNLKINVALGGGRKAFSTRNGKRKDGRELIDDWVSFHNISKSKARYVTTRDELRSVKPEENEYLLGLFSDSHLGFDDQRSPSEPSLVEMTEKAVDVLSYGDQGFFLMLEGGRIDHAHHINHAKYALSETLALEKAVEHLKNRLNMEETLIIVTSDHSHSFSVSGYAKKGTSIYGFSEKNDKFGNQYPLLMYSSGPGANPENVKNRAANPSYHIKPSAVWLSSAAHSGADVAVYAIGPHAHSFTRTHDQDYVAHVIMMAACIGPYKDGGAYKEMFEHCRAAGTVGVTGSASVQTSFSCLTLTGFCVFSKIYLFFK